MTRRRGLARVVGVESRRPVEPFIVSVQGCAGAMPERATSALERLLAIGMAVDAASRAGGRSGA